MMSVPVMSEGIRSGVNWIRLNSRPRVFEIVLHHERLRGAWQSGDEAMAADEERGQNLIEHLFLSDDDLANLAEDSVPYQVEPVDALFKF